MSTLPANALCTRKEFKDYLNITGDDNTKDNLIHDLIGRVSKAFETYCGRSFVQETFTEYYDGDGMNQIFLDHYPVQSITSLHDDSDWVWGSDTLIASSNYRIMDERSIVYDGMFSTSRQSVKVVYVAGYSTIPTDLKQVCIEEVARLFKRAENINVQNRSNDTETVTYLNDTFTPLTMTVLNKYKMVSVL